MRKQYLKKRSMILTLFYRQFPLLCFFLIVFDLTTTIIFSIANMKESSRDMIARTESQISEYIHSVWNLGEAIADAPSTRDDSLSLRQRAQLLVPYAEKYDLFMLGITDAEGFLGSTLQREKITSKAMINEKGIADLSSRPAFQEMMATGKAVLTDTYLAGADAKTRIYTIWIPYYEKDAIAGAITVSIKFSFISNIIESTSLQDNYYFSLLDSRNVISANPQPFLYNKRIEEAYAESLWVSIPVEELKQALNEGKSGSYWGINNNRLEYITYKPVKGTSWKLIMRTDFFGSFRNTFYSLGLKTAVYLSLFFLFLLKRNRDVFARERLYDMMTANVKDIFLVYDLKKPHIEYISGNVERVLGLPIERLMEDAEFLRTHIGDIPNIAFTEGNCSRNCEIRNFKTGELHSFRLQVYNIFENGKHWVIVVLSDVSEEHKQKRLLENALEMARRADMAKSTFLSNMSHDIRTPMNAIVGMVALAAAHAGDKDRVLGYLSKIMVANNHLLGLINDVLEMSKIESGNLPLKNLPFMLPELCRELLIMVRPLTEKKKIALFISTEGIRHEKVIGDKLRLIRVFINLVGNAVKFTEQGGSLHIRIKELDSMEDGCALYEFSFQDTGSGIAPESLEKIFLPFERLEEDHTTSKSEGSGLGLAITQQIVSLMGGEIHVDSVVGKGSCFTVRVLMRTQEEKEEYYIPSQWKGRQVLIVDESAEQCQDTVRMMMMFDIKCKCASSEEAAVREIAAAGERYQALFLGKKEPGQGSIATIRRLRQLAGGKLPIVIVTAYDWADFEKEAYAEGVTAFVERPLFKSAVARVFEIIQSDDVFHHPEEENDIPSFGKRRILLVEDNELNMEIAQEFLLMADLMVETAFDGKEAVEKFAASPVGYYDMVLTDVQMPVMNGYEEAAAIRAMLREDAKSIPIVAMTANAFAEDVQRAMESGMNEHIGKPISFNRVMEILRKWFIP